MMWLVEITFLEYDLGIGLVAILVFVSDGRIREILDRNSKKPTPPTAQ